MTELQILRQTLARAIGKVIENLRTYPDYQQSTEEIMTMIDTYCANIHDCQRQAKPTNEP
jgi:uncharacterized protein (UPF0218 family)